MTEKRLKIRESATPRVSGRSLPDHTLSWVWLIVQGGARPLQVAVGGLTLWFGWEHLGNAVEKAACVPLTGFPLRHRQRTDVPAYPMAD